MDLGSIISPDIADKLINLLLAVIQAVVIALITKNALDRALRKEKEIGKRLKDYGVESVKSGDGKMSDEHLNLAFGLRGHQIPNEIDLCFITGRAFFRDLQQKNDYIGRAVEHGCKVRVLLANPYCGVLYEKWKDIIEKGDMEGLRTGDYVKAVAQYYYQMLTEETNSIMRNAAFIERSDAMLIHSKIKETIDDQSACLKALEEVLGRLGDHRYQVLQIEKMLQELSERADRGGGHVEVRYYTDEYRLPVTLVRKNATEYKEAVTLLWTNMNAAIRETTESINIFCKVKETETSRFVKDIEDTFEYLWNRYPNPKKLQIHIKG